MITRISLSEVAVWTLGALAGAALVAILAASASADLLDPATLHTGTGAGATCATGGAATGPCQYL